MQDSPNSFDVPMLGLDTKDWLEKLEEVTGEDGYFQPLGPRHVATLLEDKPTLLVTFETIDDIQARGDTGQPLGFELVKELGWSHLCIISDGNTWFRDPAVYAYFDRLSDDGFFDEFDDIVFYGSGPCGYAACAFSVAAPGARVVAINPQATLLPDIAGWDDRFPGSRRMSFSDRYGYAPDMIEAADKAFILFSRENPLDAMHAALFRRDNAELIAVPSLGAPLEESLLGMQVLFRILVQAGTAKLTRQRVFRLLRARRENKRYLRHLVTKLQKRDRIWLAAILCAYVIQRMNAPRFERMLSNLEKVATEKQLAS